MRQNVKDSIAVTLCVVAILVVGLFMLYGVILNVAA